MELEEEKWIADVGFGGQTLTAPIRLVSDLVQTTPHGEYRLLQEGDGWVLQFNHHQHWQSMYRFDLCEQQQSDYVMGNFWSAHWPQSHFSPSFADVPPFAGRWQANADQFSFYPLRKWARGGAAKSTGCGVVICRDAGTVWSGAWMMRNMALLWMS
ncbi:Putative N-hydroxyarylamine O-acetyltransferase [Escherichia coli]|uniref:N-hydroxyarylamine O-acetyltransferase n=1 Tax=Escherichia coli TaxID=562 RepID=A0A376UA44_ECOLX|nr:Putative N-hydroxyarylamine O-acetyltransferase [Escherichia coli]